MEKGQIIENENGSAYLIWYDESPSGYPRPRCVLLSLDEYTKYKKRNKD